MGWLASAAMGLAGLTASSLASDSTKLLSVPDYGTPMQVLLERAGDRVALTTIGPAEVYVAFDVDVQSDGKIERATDLSYQVMGSGKLCVSKWASEKSIVEGCTGASAAKLSTWRDRELTVRRIEIPISEISRNGRSILLRVATYDIRNPKLFTHDWLKYDLATRTADSVGISEQARSAPGGAR